MNEGEWYRQFWAFMWPLGLAVIGVAAILILHSLKKTIRAAAQQNLVQLLMNGRWYLVDHPELFERDSQNQEFLKFVNERGGITQHLTRRNILVWLELLYFQRRQNILDKEFFESHCRHVWPWFGSREFREVWDMSKSLHTKKFQEFVDKHIDLVSEEKRPL